MREFEFKPFEEMTPEDYAQVGFKSGLEVHQQLLTEKKLFCRCPAGKYHNEEYHAEILRHMRPTLSELGEYDGTALMEFKTKKNITYRIHYDTVCTYEMDDTPPFMMNDQALDIAVEIGMLMNAQIVDEIHIARKQYLDGSIPTGFQRTAITSVGGYIPYKDKKIDLIQMSIEEDSCREFSDWGHNRIYLTDRLGMPLIETVTHPQMKTPQEVAEVNDILRRIVRSTGHVRTGIGASRQDVNVSVEGGTRIEIKGVSRIPLIPRLTYNEAMRQWNLLKLRDELHCRGIKEDTFESSYHDVTRLLKKTRFHPISESIAQGKVVYCSVLKGFKGLLTWKTQTDTYFSKELSDRVRVIACIPTVPNIIHSDSPTENLSSSKWSELKKFVGATDEDTIVLVWGNREDAEMGAKEIIIRAKEATIGIPSETRQALSDGTTGFERILPGPERMYPDTDLPPKILTNERKDKIFEQLPENYWEREKKYRSLGICDDVSRELAISKFARLFKEIIGDYDINPKIAAKTLIIYPKILKKRRHPLHLITEDVLKNILIEHSKGNIPKDGIFYVLEKTIINEGYSQELLPEPLGKDEMKDLIKNEAKKMKLMKLHNPDKKEEILMGMAMTKLRGRVNGSEVRKYINDNNILEG